MKVRIATVLSLAGVFVAGSAAALVNNQVLRPTTSVVRDRPAADSIVQSQFTEPPAGVEAAPAVPPAATQATYVAAGAAAVTLDVADDTLTLIAVVPVEGWSVVRSIHHDPTTIEVALQSGSTLVEFHASLIYGIVNTSVETSDLSVPAPTTGGTVHHTGGSTGTAQPGHDDDGSNDDGDDGDDDDDGDDGDDHESEDD